MAGRSVLGLAGRSSLRIIKRRNPDQAVTLQCSASRLSAESHATPRSPMLRVKAPSHRYYSTVEGTSKRTKPPKKHTARILAVGLFLAGSFIYFTGSSSTNSQTTLNDNTFVPYTITSRTAISPSSFVLAVFPQTPNPDPPYLLPSSNRWRHPLWSVEFKQPEVQISRHYTPLPPSLAVVSPSNDVSSSEMVNVEETGERAGQLRFYIRAVGDGEMSRYLTRLRPGHTVWLRGPHVGFDLVRRLGASKSIVFLAGGTGVVPGMQAARVVLDGFEDSKVSLLWAVRKREEVHSGRGDGSETTLENASKRSWWDFRSSTKAPFELEVGMPKPSPVAAQLADMKTQYGDRLSVQVVVDEENTFFDQNHIRKALNSLSDNTTSSPSSYTSGSCSLHDQKMHEQASEFEGGSSVCHCPPTDGVLPGKNLFVVSGPEGFVSHYTGPKTWVGGIQAQGPVGGVVAAIQKEDQRFAQEWLVLKL